MIFKKILDRYELVFRVESPRGKGYLKNNFLYFYYDTVYFFQLHGDKLNPSLIIAFRKLLPIKLIHK